MGRSNNTRGYFRTFLCYTKGKKNFVGLCEVVMRNELLKEALMRAHKTVDEVAQVVSGGTSSTTALKGSTEEEQFQAHK